MHDPVLESHHLVCEKPQTRRGIERRLALLLSATELFLEKGYDAVSLLTTSSIMLVVQKPLFINTSVIKMAYLLQSAIIAVKCFLKISALHFNQSKLL